jgi:hypothetical protein
MSSRKVFLVLFVIFILILLMVNFAFSQVKKEETIFLSGIITSISRDYKFIVVYKENILISSNTKIFNEKGKPLQIDDLRPDLYVVIEGVPNPNGFLAKKIIVKKPPEV